MGHILLLLSNECMSPRPFGTISIILRVSRARKVKIILLLLLLLLLKVHMHIILFYLVKGRVRILHVLWRRTLDDWPSLGRDH